MGSDCEDANNALEGRFSIAAIATAQEPFEIYVDLDGRYLTGQYDNGFSRRSNLYLAEDPKRDMLRDLPARSSVLTARCHGRLVLIEAIATASNINEFCCKPDKRYRAGQYGNARSPPNTFT